MNNQLIHVSLYPTPAPAAEETLYEVDTVSELVFICEKLFMKAWPLQSFDRQHLTAHFRSLTDIMALEHHLEIAVAAEELLWEQLLQDLVQLLPQFAWIRCKTEPEAYGRRVYYFDFVPIALHQDSFPFDLSIAESITQQLSCGQEDAQRIVCDEIAARIQTLDYLSPVQTAKESPVQEPLTDSSSQVPDNASADTSNHQLLRYQEEIKREQYTKERLRIANEKLELMMERLELSMMYGGLNHFDSHENDDADWDKRLTISLREYSYLMQKAKYLEQMWQINGELVRKTEKMTLYENQLFYEREQVNQFKQTISSEDIYLVLDECKLIESRVKVKNRPLFRKPYVKLMAMDYESLLSKAAYFDLLQGESYLLEKLKKGASSVKTVDEFG